MRAAGRGMQAYVLAGALLLAAPAAGADATPSPRGPLAPAWRDATAAAQRSVGEETATRLTLLAYVSAAGRSCAGLAVNRARFKGAFRELAEERKGELADERRTRSALRRVSYHLGVATGLFLAEHALAPERFCTGARASIAADPEFALFFTSARPAGGESP
jgi:hypothetical protein